MFATVSHYRCLSAQPLQGTYTTNLYKHALRAGAQSATSTTQIPSLPSSDAGHAVLEDILDISKGLEDLPNDLFKLIKSVEERLHEVEGVLASLVSNMSIGPTTLPLEPGPVIPPEVPSPVSAYTPHLQPTSFRTRRTTSTKTASHTVTWHMPIPTGALGNWTVPHGNSTGIFTAPQASTVSTSSQATPTAVTQTVMYATQISTNAASSTPIENTSMTLRMAQRLRDTPPPYTFRADAEDNVAVYYGTTEATQPGGLQALCESPNVDIVILSFLFSFFDANGYPSIDFGSSCSGQTDQQASLAPGLKDCTALAPEIAVCQSIGKKVLISLGGYIASTNFASEDQANQLAGTLWNLFGAGTGDDPKLRPFGPDTIVDGFDIDNESHNADYYDTFTIALRAQFAQDSSKTYYLSAAPKCPVPDGSIPLSVLQAADFVWVQFYNNPSCNLDSDGFQASFAAWSELLSRGPRPGWPKLYVGAPSFEKGGSGYVAGSALSYRFNLAVELYVDNMGGMMLWDGSEAMDNVDQDTIMDYLSYAKAAAQVL